MSKTYRFAVIGYGGAFNQGKHHANAIVATDGFELVAVCDMDPARAESALEDFPSVRTYTDVDQMLMDEESLDVAVIVTPHDTHAPIALKCMDHGVGVIIEKPMCITWDEATQMIKRSQEQNVLLSVFHNRRFDASHRTMKKIIDSGAIGRIFKVEICSGGYSRPGEWWRSYKEFSGGVAYDWGAHYIDWLLDLIPSDIAEISGWVIPDVAWPEVSNEDYWESTIQFKDGTRAHLEFGSVLAHTNPTWRILGEKGAIIPGPERTYEVRTWDDESGALSIQIVQEEPHMDTGRAFYDNIAAHLFNGEPLIITPESSRQVIAVLDGTERAWREGQPFVPSEES